MSWWIVTLAREQEGSEKDQGVRLTTSYPVIRGPSDAAFEFSVEVDSRLDKEAIVDLFAQGPKGWDINFKPAYETKFISSIRLKANQSQTIAVEVKPALNSPAGEYPISLRVSAGDAKTEANLTVILTGTYGLDAGTPSGLLSLEARQGLPANVSFFVKNTGSAVNHDIKFMTFRPENWKVEFKPERIDRIEPNGLQQVEMIITPYEEALVGDYSVGVKVERVKKPPRCWNSGPAMGRKRLRPVKRSSKVPPREFADYVNFIQRKAAEMGILIADPDPEWFLKEPI